MPPPHLSHRRFFFTSAAFLLPTPKRRRMGRRKKTSSREAAAEHTGSFIELVACRGCSSHDRQGQVSECRIQREERRGGVGRASRSGPGHLVACRALSRGICGSSQGQLDSDAPIFGKAAVTSHSSLKKKEEGEGEGSIFTERQQPTLTCLSNKKENLPKK